VKLLLVASFYILRLTVVLCPSSGMGSSRTVLDLEDKSRLWPSKVAQEVHVEWLPLSWLIIIIVNIVCYSNVMFVFFCDVVGL